MTSSTAARLTVIEPLSANEKALLADCEARIEGGLNTVAEALATIRDGRLYREQHATFEDYCQSMMHKTSRRMNQVIAAGQVVMNLQAAGIEPSQLPTHESQARSIASLTQESRSRYGNGHGNGQRKKSPSRPPPK